MNDKFYEPKQVLELSSLLVRETKEKKPKPDRDELDHDAI